MSAGTCVFALLLALTFGLLEAADFADNVDGFDFIYHETHDLILTIYNGTCFFTRIPDNGKSFMARNGKTALEGHIKNTVLGMDKTEVHASTLDAMRDEYKDRLADYHCFNKAVYSLQMTYPAETVTCNFESATKPLCGFVQDSSDNYSWTRKSGPTASADTGPHADHTYGSDGAHTGHYMYTEVSSHHPGDKARLIWHVQSLTRRCLQFYYHMYGSGVGTLKVYVTNQTSTAHLTHPVWSLSGNQGNGWHLGAVNIPQTTDFQLVFEGVTGSDFHGDIAIDDITISEGRCPRNVTVTPTNAPKTARLVGGTSTSGRLEVLHNGVWGTVCDDDFGGNEAKVACKMLGYSTGSHTVLRHHSYPGGRGQIWLDELDCSGHEDTLWDCHHLRPGSNDCKHGEDVAISCGSGSSSTGSSSSQARLVGGTSTAGRLEIYYNGHWGAVCGRDFGNEEVDVACRMLGLTSGEPTILNNRNPQPEPAAFDRLHCTGHESNLLDCHHMSPGPHAHHSCTTVAISCGSRCHNNNHWYPDGVTVHTWHNNCDSVCNCKNGVFNCPQVHCSTHSHH